MTATDDVETKLLKVKELREVELALDFCERAERHNAIIDRIKAEDDAKSERSIEVKFTAEESGVVFRAVASVLQTRATRLKNEIGA